MKDEDVVIQYQNSGDKETKIEGFLEWLLSNQILCILDESIAMLELNHQCGQSVFRWSHWSEMNVYGYFEQYVKKHSISMESSRRFG
jgi:hypothetical protein